MVLKIQLILKIQKEKKKWKNDNKVVSRIVSDTIDKVIVENKDLLSNNNNNNNNKQMDDIENLRQHNNTPIEIESSELVNHENNTPTIDDLIKLPSSRSSTPEAKGIIANKTAELDDVDKLYHALKTNFRGLKMNKQNVFMVITKAVELADKIEELEGYEKYVLVNNTMHLLIKEMKIDALEKEFISISINSIINTIIDSSKGNLLPQKKDKRINIDDTQRVSIGQIVATLLDKLLTIILKQKYKPEEIIVNITVFIGMIIKSVEEYKYLTPIEKKEVVLQTLDILINKKLPKLYKMNSKTKQMLGYALLMAPQTIDMLLSIKDKYYDINKVDIIDFKKKMKKMWKKITEKFSCCKCGKKEK
jgi:hypothetical protein